MQRGPAVARRQLTADGFELSLAVNHLAPFLLTNLLKAAQVDRQRAGQGRDGLVDRASGSHVSRPWTTCSARTVYLAMLAYANSKLANVLFTRELARRLDGSKVTANCLHPGTVRTRFGDTGALWLRLGLAVGGGVLRTPEVEAPPRPRIWPARRRWLARPAATTSTPSAGIRPGRPVTTYSAASSGTPVPPRRSRHRASARPAARAPRPPPPAPSASQWAIQCGFCR